MLEARALVVFIIERVAIQHLAGHAAESLMRVVGSVTRSEAMQRSTGHGSFVLRRYGNAYDGGGDAVREGRPSPQPFVGHTAMASHVLLTYEIASRVSLCTKGSTFLQL